ncbi:efflux RND transporter periplasmic adaptor subunit [bacterium]|nr:efflux RND transporter periplasmic adaptor subunit [bacterium]
MKRIALLLIGISIMFVGCNTDDDGMDMEIAVPVSVQEIKPQPMEEYVATTGTAVASEEAALVSELSGYYRVLNNKATGKPFMLGDEVAKGQVIIEVSDPEYSNNVKIESQKLNLEISESEFNKQRSLYDKGGVTLRELRNSEVAYINAKYAYENACLQMDKMRIKAPFDGRIIDLPYYTKGVRVSSATPLVTIMNYRQLILETQLPAKEMGRVEAGQDIRVMNYTNIEDTLVGRITQVSPAVDKNTRTFKAMMIINNPQWILRPGMFVKAEIIVAREDSALVIPKDVILSKQRGKTVFIIEKGAAQQRVIRTGLENPKQVQVLRGVEANERLVIKGFETLRRGSKVKIVR